MSTDKATIKRILAPALLEKDSRSITIGEIDDLSGLIAKELGQVVMTHNEAAELAGVDPETLRRHRVNGEICASPVNPHAKRLTYRYNREDVLMYMSSSRARSGRTKGA